MNQIEVVPGPISSFGYADDQIIAVPASDLRAMLQRIADLEEQVTKLVEYINTLHDESELERARDRQRITKLEHRREPSEETAQRHLDHLFEEMHMRGLRQVSVTMAAKLIGLSRSRMHEIKKSISDDPRFVVVRDPRHKQRELIRITANVKLSGRTVDSFSPGVQGPDGNQVRDRNLYIPPRTTCTMSDGDGSSG